MEPQNGVPQSQPVAPAVPTQPAAPATPQVPYAQVGPTGQPVAAPAAPAQTQQQVNELAQLRQGIAQDLQIDVSQVPSDMASLRKIVVGGYAAANRLQQMGTVQQPPAPTQPTPAATQPSNPMQLHSMPPGWETLVERAQDGSFTPKHPSFAEVARMANHNAGAAVLRQNASNNGQLLPEQQQSVEQIVQERMAQQRQQWEEDSFFEQNGSTLFKTDANGNYMQEIDPATMQPQKALTDVGMEMKQVAAELLQKRIKFDSRADFAKYTLQIAQERIKNRQQVQPAQTQQTQQTNDLASLLAGHQQSGAARVANSQNAPIQYADMRSELRSGLQNAPVNANGVDFARMLGLFPQ